MEGIEKSFEFFFKNGIIGIDIVNKINYFKCYEHHRKNGHNKMDSYEFAAIECRVSSRTIMRACDFFYKHQNLQRLTNAEA